MSIGGVDWRMAQPMQAQSAAPDWRQMMQTAVMGGAGMPTGGGANAPFDPAALPGMAQQQQQAAGRPSPAPVQAPVAPAPLTPTTGTSRITPAPADPAQRAELMKPALQEIKPGVMWKAPDGSMFDIYGNQWTPGGHLTPGGM